MASDSASAFDLVIENGTLIDGTGAARRAADIGITSGRVTAVAVPGALPAGGRKRIDAAGRIVAPGFIDTHTHDDSAVLANPEMTPKISQGVTTVIAGNCGISLAPLVTNACPPPLNVLGDVAAYRFPTVAAYAAAVDEARPATNVALLVGHSTLRVGAMHDLTRKANTAELDAMRGQLHAALEDGAFGFSTGTYYKTSAAADEDEIVALAELLPPYGGVYATHMRDEHAGVLKSLAETFDTASRAKVRVVISHHKCAGPDNWGRSVETLAVIAEASKHQAIGLDVYPYNAGSTVLDPDFIDERYRIVVSWSDPHPEMTGRDLSDIASEWGISQKEAVVRLSPGGGVYFSMDERDVRRILSYPDSMIGSDGLPRDERPHPRLWGTFPRVLGHYSRDEKLFSLERAVHKMTGLSAGNFGLKDRGVIRIGAIADIVVFDAETVADRATFESPKQTAAGIDHVIVGGVPTWRLGEPTGNRAGQFVRH